MALTETWFREKGDEALLEDIKPVGYDIASFPRSTRAGGGIALIFRSELSPLFTFPSQQTTNKTFESVDFTIEQRNIKTHICIIYRTPTGKNNRTNVNEFVHEFQDTLTSLALKNQLLIMGDFNIHFEYDNPGSRAIKSMLDDFEMIQHVNSPTQKCGHTLDWVITNHDLKLISPVTVEDDCISDHRSVYFKIPSFIKKHPKSKLDIVSRNTRNINVANLKSDLSTELSKYSDIDINNFNSALSKVFEEHAPLTKRKVKERKSTPWFSLDMKKAKREKRRAEEKWKKTKLTIHREIYIQKKRDFKRISLKEKSNFYKTKIDNVKNSKEFFQITDNLLGHTSKPQLPKHDNEKELADKFSEYFQNKISRIRHELDHGRNNECDINVERGNNSDEKNLENSNVFCGDYLEKFKEVSEEQIIAIINTTKNKSCQLDPMPTEFLKESLNELAPYITKIVNDSLRTGVFPDTFKTAIVKPLLKKQDLNAEDYKNYRPVSNLPYLSKLVEKIVLQQLNEHLAHHELHEPLQSAYRRNHSTETALLRVASDLSTVIDNGGTTLLNLLDLSAAFDTIDHDILLQRLENNFGCRGAVLNWFRTYLTHRYQSVLIGECFSDKKLLPFGVPQGSVLGPVLFSLYTTPLGNIIKTHKMDHHLYADDTQLYDTDCKASMKEKVARCEKCIKNVSEWMNKNKLKLNEEKTEVLIIGNKNRTDKIEEQFLEINDSKISFVKKVRNLGVTFDSELSMNDHVSQLKKKLYFDLKKISSIRYCLSKDACQKLVSSLMFSKFDYCNSLLSGTSVSNIRSLQAIQNNAARLVAKKKRQDDANQIMMNLHWLPVKLRIDYKVATLVFKCLENTAPSYLTEMIEKYQPRRCLRSSSNKLVLKTPKIRLRTGEKSFRWSGPNVWNKLPLNVRELESLATFKKGLKTHYYRTHYYEL